MIIQLYNRSLEKWPRPDLHIFGHNYKYYVAIYKHAPNEMLTAFMNVFEHSAWPRQRLLTFFKHLVKIQLYMLYVRINDIITQRKFYQFPFKQYPYFTAYLREHVEHFEDRYPLAARDETVVLWSRNRHAYGRPNRIRIRAMWNTNFNIVMKACAFPPEISRLIRKMVYAGDRQLVFQYGRFFEGMYPCYAHDVSVRKMVIHYTINSDNYYRYILGVLFPGLDYNCVETIMQTVIRMYTLPNVRDFSLPYSLRLLIERLWVLQYST